MNYQSVNPYNGDLIKTFSELTDRQLEERVATASRCFETWRARSTGRNAYLR